ncbi:hypothetical protein BD414DRAFT_580887 [Trametes punicea]|nr:hypothetical protein BD414DRAFT_580887 [Trametes punicea]
MTGAEANRLGEQVFVNLASDDQAYLMAIPPSQILPFTRQKIDEYLAEIVKLDGYVRALKKIHNVASPINTMLPAELLMEIFRHVRPRKRAEIGIGHVCGYWRTVLQRTPEFWADLISIPENVVLRTEGDRPFFLSFLSWSFPRMLELTFEGNCLPMMLDAGDHLSRIRTLDIKFEGDQLIDYLPSLAELPRFDLSSLEELVLTVSEVPSSVVEQAPEYGHYYFYRFFNSPRLHTLRTNGSFFTPFLAFSSLQHATLVGEEPSYLGTTSYLEAHTYPLLLAALRYCRNLETLDLSFCLPRNIDFSSNEILHPLVHLEKLRTLTVSDEAWHVRRFLEQVTFPSSTRVDVHNMAPNWRYCYSEVLPRTSDLEVISLTERMTLKFDSLRWRCSLLGFAGDMERFSIHSKWLYSLDDLQLDSLSTVFSISDRVTELELVLDDFMQTDAQRWGELMAAFPNITRLTVRVPSCRGLVEALSTGQSPTHLVPHLEELDIECEDSQEERVGVMLSSALRAREAASGVKPKHWNIRKMDRIQEIEEGLAGLTTS